MLYGIHDSVMKLVQMSNYTNKNMQYVSITSRSHNQKLCVRQHGWNACGINLKSKQYIVSHRIISYVSYRLYHIVCVISYIICIISYVSYRMYHIVCITSYVSYRMYYVVCIISYVSYHMYHIRKSYVSYRMYHIVCMILYLSFRLYHIVCIISYVSHRV